MPNYIYTFNHDYHLQDLCKLEARQIFDTEIENKLLFSALEIDPSISAFIKTRLKICVSASDFTELLTKVKAENIEITGFNVEYLVLDGNTIERTPRRKKIRDIGFVSKAYLSLRPQSSPMPSVSTRVSGILVLLPNITTLGLSTRVNHTLLATP